MADEQQPTAPTDPTAIPMGNRTANVYKYDADGNRIPASEISKDQAAKDVVTSMSGVRGAHDGTPGLTDYARTGFETARDAVTGAVAKAGQYSPIDVLQAAIAKASGGRVPTPTPLAADEDANRYAKRVVPQTPAGAAVTLAAGPLGRLGWVAAPAAGAAIGSGAEALTGGNPLTGAEEGAIGGAATKAIPAVVKGVTGAVQRFAGFGTGAAAARSLSEEAATNLAGAIKNDVPELGTAMSGKGSVPQQLLDLQRTGPKALSTMMESTENQIAAAVPNVQIPITPAGGAAALTPSQQQALARMPQAIQQQVMARAGASGPVSKTVSIKDAFSELQNLKDQAYYLKAQRDRGTLGNLQDFKSAMDQVSALQQNIENALGTADPKLLAAWKGAVAKYDYGKRYLDLANSALAGEDAAGTPFNIGSMVKSYLQDVKSFGRLPSEAKLFGGGELGTQPEMTHVGVPFIGHMPTGVPGLNIYGRGPGLSFVTQPGQSYGANVHPLAILPGLMSLADRFRGQ